eukprot:CAMPEP_0172401532 /NCGR_PEP_ID=MMETSP1061-20121228/50627_1 /TAXON_ID=37318 /ORGANISM="Pseudo-nitzschia pungens, Strain cf. pungens" /LENGTH=564 /DNA_ID=CAMNT_0013135203 /DNA_START=216 /DNA_END=1910 /DNA_ORIENTATION=+
MKRRTRNEVGEAVQVDENTENMVSKSLMKLSFDDRSAIEEEIHGVSCMAREETQELIKESLANFDLELEKIDHKPGYLKAKELALANSSRDSCCWLATREFKLRFLRCELFDAQKAASRFVRCHDFLFDLYGEYALRRPIRMTDLNREEMAFLRDGQYQLLPYRDRSGRRIYAIVVKKRNHIPKRVLHKVFFYLWFVLSGGTDIANHDINNIETQRKGAVIIFIPSQQVYSDTDNILSQIKFVQDRASANAYVAEIIPLRVAAIHLCLPKTCLAQISLQFGYLLTTWNVRIKVHLGEFLELRYTLQSYGIPTDLIPSTDSGNIKIANWKQWMKLRKHVERNEQGWMAAAGTPYSSDSDSGAVSTEAEASVSTETAMMNVVECPLSTDVIFRRGRSLNNHPGNVMFQNLIELRIHEHTIDPNTTQARRQSIEMELIEEVRNNGGRFLKWEIDKSCWVVMGLNVTTGKKTQEIDKEIVSKVHYAFRDFRKKMLKTQQNIILNSSSTHIFEREDWQKRSRLNNTSELGNAISSGSSSGNESFECFGFGSNECRYLFCTDHGFSSQSP